MPDFPYITDIKVNRLSKKRDSIIADNKALNNKVQSLEKEYMQNNLDFDYNNRKINILTKL